MSYLDTVVNSPDLHHQEFLKDSYLENYLPKEQSCAMQNTALFSGRTNYLGLNFHEINSL